MWDLRFDIGGFQRYSLFSKNVWWPWKRPFVCICVVKQLKRVLHGYVLPAGCPLAWWWHAWRGWRTSWCPRRVRLSKPLTPPGEPSLLSSGIAGRSWSPGRFTTPDAGRGVFPVYMYYRSGEGKKWILGGYHRGYIIDNLNLSRYSERPPKVMSLCKISWISDVPLLSYVLGRKIKGKELWVICNGGITQ